jgi:hypothetical protein
MICAIVEEPADALYDRPATTAASLASLSARSLSGCPV